MRHVEVNKLRPGAPTSPTPTAVVHSALLRHVWRFVFVGVDEAGSRFARVLSADVVYYAGSGFTTPVWRLLKGSEPFSRGPPGVADAEKAQQRPKGRTQ